MALDTKKSTSLRDGYGQTYRDGGFVEVNDKMADLVDSGVFKVASTVSVTSGSRTVRSGAMTIPGGSIITDLGAVVTTATTQASSTQGIQFGTGSDGYDITGKGDVENFNVTAATALTVGRGTTMYTQSSSPLGARIELPVNAHDTGLFFASDTDIHGTISSSVSFGTGEFTFVVKYTNIV
tara:strand:- start:256 stop:798 length:543 start_codon:yes stop_codon:yes gene_type:complete